MKDRHKERNRRIVSYYFEDRTLQECGNRFGLTRERVRQILNELGHTTRGHTPAVLKETLTKNRPHKQTTKERFWSQVDIRSKEECWQWQSYSHPESGYGILSVTKLNERYAHRIAYILHYRRKIHGEILHSCDNRRCVNPHHLKDGTRQENISDRVQRRSDYWYERRWGGQSSSRKFSMKEVVEMKQMRKSGLSYIAIAKHFDTQNTTVSNILRGKVQAYKIFL